MHIIDNCSIIGRSEVLILATTRTNLGNMMRSEISQIRSRELLNKDSVSISGDEKVLERGVMVAQ